MSLKMIDFKLKNVSGRNRPVVKPFKIDTKNEGLQTHTSDSSKSISNLNGSTKVLKIIDFINKMRRSGFRQSPKPSKLDPKMNAWRQVYMTLQNQMQK